MPQLDFDGANSKISADKIQGQSGTTVTVPTGHKIAGTDANSITINGVNAVAVAPSTSGNVLTSNGSAWASSAPAGGGVVLQVLQKQVTEMNSFTFSAHTYADVGVSLAITPSSSDSKILVVGTICIGHNMYAGVRILRDSTAIGVGTSGGSRTACHIGNQNYDAASLYESFIHPLHWIDSPASSSELVYKVQFSANSSGTACLNREHTAGDHANRTIPVSTITLMELSSATVS